MSSTPSYRTDAPGIVLPPKIAAIAADHRKHPEKGRLLDIIMAYRKQNISNASNSKKKRRAERNIAIMSSSKQFTYRSLTPCGLPVFDGSILAYAQRQQQRWILLNVQDIYYQYYPMINMLQLLY